VVGPPHPVTSYHGIISTASMQRSTALMYTCHECSIPPRIRIELEILPHRTLPSGPQHGPPPDMVRCFSRHHTFLSPNVEYVKARFFGKCSAQRPEVVSLGPSPHSEVQQKATALSSGHVTSTGLYFDSHLTRTRQTTRRMDPIRS
jgi:hypothetical protein